MRLFLVSALLVAAAAPAVAATHEFSQDGDRYSYTAARAADGSVVLNGRVESSGDRFALHVNGREVEGQVGERPVSFAITKKMLAELETEVPTQTAAVASATMAPN